MTNLRIFDALNDTRNLKTAIQATKEFGGHAQGALSYTVSPVHTVDAFVQMAVELEEMGADSVCIKDMAGLLIAPVAYDLVKANQGQDQDSVVAPQPQYCGSGQHRLLRGRHGGASTFSTAPSLPSPMARASPTPSSCRRCSRARAASPATARAISSNS